MTTRIRAAIQTTAIFSVQSQTTLTRVGYTQDGVFIQTDCGPWTVKQAEKMAIRAAKIQRKKLRAAGLAVTL